MIRRSPVPDPVIAYHASTDDSSQSVQFGANGTPFELVTPFVLPRYTVTEPALWIVTDVRVAFAATISAADVVGAGSENVFVPDAPCETR